MRRLALVVVLACLSLAACAKPLKPGALGEASSQYAAGQYQPAYATASRLARQDNFPARAEAAYVAGLSARQLGNLNAAEDYLLQATGAGDARLRGDAFASLGLVYAQRERYDAAAQAMLRAAENLQGAEQANAYYHAGVSQQKLGRFAQARTSLTLARRGTTDAGFVEEIDRRLSQTGYTLQIGAYREESNARQAAEQLAARAIELRYGAPRIVPSQDPRGGSLQIVQIGQFSTFASAKSARGQLGANDAMIVPLP